jgi:RNase adaptor protein for sRNA GlmZ degradation
LFFDCAGGELLRRYSETRRRTRWRWTVRRMDGIAAERS